MEAKEDLQELQKLIWGSNFNEAVFKNWSGGFCFSERCSTCLVQEAGGPCYVLAPVQAFIIKHLLPGKVHQANRDRVEEAFVLAMVEILQQANGRNSDFTVVLWKNAKSTHSGQGLSSFTDHLEFNVVKSSELNSFLKKSLEFLKMQFGILCFLYSVLLTHGIKSLKNEMSDSEPLIESTHGYGSQALTNLFVTGKAVMNVWNGEKEVGGLLLRGISAQPQIGYLSYLEHSKHIEVGTYLKSPKNPIWVVSSESHMTVIFSYGKRLAFDETPGDEARRTFRSFAVKDGDFIEWVKLGDVLQKLGLKSDPDYVNGMKSELDPEGTGVVLLPVFMKKFFPEQSSSVPDTFDVFHWNGMVSSNSENVVDFTHGFVVLDEPNVRSANVDKLSLVMQTKWPRLNVDWDFVSPSID